MQSVLGELIAAIPTVENDKLLELIGKLNCHSEVVILEVMPEQEASIITERFRAGNKCFVVIAVTV